MIEGISAVTLGTHEMPRAVRFYYALGFEVLRGNEQSSFTSFRAGMSLAVGQCSIYALANDEPTVNALQLANRLIWRHRFRPSIYATQTGRQGRQSVRLHRQVGRYIMRGFRNGHVA
jgi:hypothetical protein